jgi:hypothetical protein
MIKQVIHRLQPQCLRVSFPLSHSTGPAKVYYNPKVRTQLSFSVVFYCLFCFGCWGWNQHMLRASQCPTVLCHKIFSI